MYTPRAHLRKAAVKPYYYYYYYYYYCYYALRWQPKKGAHSLLEGIIISLYTVISKQEREPIFTATYLSLLFFFFWFLFLPPDTLLSNRRQREQVSLHEHNVYANLMTDWEADWLVAWLISLLWVPNLLQGGNFGSLREICTSMFCLVPNDTRRNFCVEYHAAHGTTCAPGKVSIYV